MSATIGTFFAFIALLIAWNRLKKVARAVVRDKLFALRDTLRQHYVANGLDMTDGTYGQIRGLLNNLLRYTKDMRMVGYLYFAAHVDQSDVDAAATKFDESLRKCDEATAKLIRGIRKKACDIILLYMAATSLSFISAMVAILIYLLPKKLLASIKRCMNNLFVFKPSTLVYAATL
ncbi:MAG: hypothetical protein IKO01_09125 [Kiritimatiellae bacterium]|nr:hypothetical protein [Kiritimatiellia bacterium]